MDGLLATATGATRMLLASVSASGTISFNEPVFWLPGISPDAGAAGEVVPCAGETLTGGDDCVKAAGDTGNNADVGGVSIGPPPCGALRGNVGS